MGFMHRGRRNDEGVMHFAKSERDLGPETRKWLQTAAGRRPLTYAPPADVAHVLSDILPGTSANGNHAHHLPGVIFSASTTSSPVPGAHPPPLLIKLAAPPPPDYYALLAIPPSASPADIKRAYHRLLLLSHPDKRAHAPSPASGPPPPIDIDLVKQAYTTLSSPAARAAYDASLRALAHAPRGPRPAAVISLEDFEEGGADAGWSVWRHACRCGGAYVITEREMDAGEHLVGCESCSEVVWVGYELAEGDRDGES
ncbi:hypothetical protein OBBRIDRAFT_837263 [Obba rivulosa]|uniref:Diphthamide biosynthesis protein 4 n=1 Tax=Obba rivulosa TaxID=1052685 RepID=A0A8E2AVP8_9APHY|nr:hypothetical protein OBBRIDRAFT_837263 [Obba rivulosa]